MTDDNLEQRLRSLSTPELPADWQREILRTARRAARNSSQNREVWPAFLVRLRSLFARNPVTMGGLATLWLLIFLFHATTPVDRASQALIAQMDPNRPVDPLLISEEIRLALLDQGEENSPPERLRP